METAPLSARNIRSIIWLCVAAMLIGFAVLIVLSAFERLPIESTNFSLDWKNIYSGIKGASITYSQEHDGLRNPPWSVLFILPLGLLSYRTSWGLISLATLAVTITSVPRLHSRLRYYAAVFLLIFSYSSIRHLADGNLEALIIGGILVILYGIHNAHPVALAIGVLLASAKIQETWLFLIFCAVIVLRFWPTRQWLNSALIIFGVVAVSSIWSGREWILALTNAPQVGQGTELDISLSAFFGRANLSSVLFFSCWLVLFVSTLYIAFRKRFVTREKVALLICASMLLSPYTAGNSFLTILAIGATALFSRRFWLGVLLILLCDIQYFLPRDFAYQYSSFYTTALLLLTWGIMAWSVIETENNLTRLRRSKYDPAR